MPNISKDRTVRVTAQPEIPKNLINSTKLRDLMRSELRDVQDKKPDIAKYQPRGSK